MASDLSSMAGVGAGMAAPRPEAKTPPTANSAVQVHEAPKLQPLKPVAIHFDRVEMRQSIQEAVNLLNQQISASNRGLGFHVDQAINGPVVTVRNMESGDVVRQIPNETVLNIAHNLDRMKGLLFNKKT